VIVRRGRVVIIGRVPVGPIRLVSMVLKLFCSSQASRQGDAARRRGKASRQGVAARRRGKASRQGVAARRRGKASRQVVAAT
jgi:hypothetical protein